MLNLNLLPLWNRNAFGVSDMGSRRTPVFCFEKSLTLLSFWYGTEIAASPCQRKFPSREKRKLSFKNTALEKKRKLCRYIFLRLVPHGYGWRRKIGKFSWQWDRRGPTRHSAAQYWKGRRNLSSQLRLNQYKHQNSFSIHSEATPAPTNILQVPKRWISMWRPKIMWLCSIL